MRQRRLRINTSDLPSLFAGRFLVLNDSRSFRAL